MPGIPLHLRGAAHVAFHQQSRAYTTEWHSGSLEQRLARNEFLRRLLGVRDDLFGGELRARGHQLENIAASEGVDFLDGPVRILMTKEILVLDSLRQLVQGAPKPLLGVILG